MTAVRPAWRTEAVMRTWQVESKGSKMSIGGTLKCETRRIMSVEQIVIEIS